MEKKITVLIADIVSSRKTKNREKVQKKIERILQAIKENKTENGLVSNPSIVRGDEFEIAFKDAKSCFKIFREIERKFYPNRLRGGIGIGELTTKIRENTSEMDGPVFHRSRKALDKAMKSKEEPIFLIRCGDKKIEETLDTLLNLLYSVKNDWTKREREFAEYYLSKKEKTHKEIAKHFGVSRSSVSRTLSRAHIQAIKKAEDLISKNLSQLDGG